MVATLRGACLILALAGSLGWGRTSMPSPPVTYTDITTVPVSVTTTQATFNVANEKWFRYIASADAVLETYTDKGGTFIPRVRIYANDGGAMTLKTGVSNAQAVSQQVTSGETYWIEVVNIHPSHVLGTSDFDFTSDFDVAALLTSITTGALVVNDDEAGFPATVWELDGTFLGFLAAIPSGEIGDTFPDSTALFHDRYGFYGGGPIALFDSTLAHVTSFDLPAAIGDFPNITHDGTQFWVVDRSRYPSPVYTVSLAGTVSAQIAEVLPNDQVSAAGVSADGTILYWAEGDRNNSSAIHRHDLNTDTPLSDLYLIADLNGGDLGSVALTGVNNHPGDILVLTDGSIVTWYRNNTVGKDVLLHLSSAGSLLHSYDYTHPIRVDHLTYSPDGPAAVRIWWYLDDFANTGRFANLILATGVATVGQTFDTDLFSAGVNLVVDSPQLIGPSSSCVMVTAGYGAGTINVTKTTVPPASTQVFDFTAGGGLSPATFDLLDGETQAFTGVEAGDGYSIAETAVGGWSTSFVVSNGSSPDNISVTAGETVTVTVTNTQIMPDEPTSPPCCSNNEHGYTGSGPTGPTGSDKPPTPPLTTPRIVPAGGEAPTYVSCSSGGGRPATASNPTDAQHLVSAKTPLVHMKWRLPDASIRRYGKRAFTSGNGQAVSARVRNWGPTRQVLSDRHGSFQANQFTVQLSDYDRALRTILSTTATKYIDGKEIELLIETAANAALGVAPLVLSRGIITGYKFNRDLTVDLSVTDPLGYRYSNTSLDRPIPYRVIGPTFPGCAETSVGRGVPIIYGEMSDDYSWTLDKARIPVGIVPVIHVGKANLISAAGIPGSEWEAFVVCGHALTCVQSVFASNLAEDGEGSVRMSASTYGSEFLVPGVNIPLYYDIVGTDGVTQRFCLFFATGERATAHITGKVPITLNVWGIEDVGDGSGDTITELAYQYQHFLQSWVLTNYMSGTWPAVPTFADGVAKIRTTTFDTVNATHAARLGTPEGYIGAMYIADQKPAREHNREFMIGGDMRTGVNHQGQVLAITVKDTSPTTGLTTYTAQDHVVQDSFEITPQVDEIFNVYTYEYGPEPATNRVSGIAQTIRDELSVTNHSERIAQALLYRTTRQKPTADDVAGRTLLRSANAPTDVTFSLDLRGVTLALGQLIRITHYQGIGVSGWTSRVLMVTGITTHPDEDDFSTTIDAEDVQGLLDAGALALQIDSGQIDISVVA